MKKQTSTAPVERGDFTGLRPEFGRDKDALFNFGLKRGTLRNLHNQGKIRGVLLRVCGSKSGVRLWDMASIRRFIEAEMKDGN